MHTECVYKKRNYKEGEFLRSVDKVHDVRKDNIN